MIRSLVTIACLMTGCTGQLSAGTGIRGPMGPSPAASEVAAEDAGEPSAGSGGYAPGEDRHWMQPDDYFVSDQAWDHGWIYVHLAKMRQAPGPTTKDQARFFQLDNSREVWTEHYWRSRPADGRDFVLGTLVLCFNDNVDHDVYRPPSNKGDARTGAWFMGKITDVSDVYKRTVRVDTYSCALDAVRAVGR